MTERKYILDLHYYKKDPNTGARIWTRTLRVKEYTGSKYLKLGSQIRIYGKTFEITGKGQQFWSKDSPRFTLEATLIV